MGGLNLISFRRCLQWPVLPKGETGGGYQWRFITLLLISVMATAALGQLEMSILALVLPTLAAKWFSFNAPEQITGAFYFQVAIVAPVLEEFIFRGLLYRFVARQLTPAKALWLTSLSFGILHPDVISAGTFSLVMIYSFILTKSILTPILLHFLNNVSVLIIDHYSGSWLLLPIDAQLQLMTQPRYLIGTGLVAVITTPFLVNLLWHYRSAFSSPYDKAFV